ncbi:RNA polymerase sigma factor [Rhodoplanes sp. TEM]|uniref:RNA polymerase sigma factor n=1 Tax=Rhodoplanes tepidamans TaxID=200616 RepID=A0ABT5JEK7_RHOTP|nr:MULTISPECIES: RNA polymerase sigma factor [Rhodoplanes]MDC7788113.1 RNA polymerase sigma factor [Rhodoplanes tepidamans]MDC7984595.1 RNA polymerase sigma factor [Rhodoplanes sp. TEM]MDQ0355596.1 RNA polymerase sigma-70 factor (ECF subfamily) [Rhodoplanes tepidamans]
MKSFSSEQTVAPDDLDTIFRLYSRELHRFAHRRLGDPEMAADVVQDAFLRYLTVTLDGRDGTAPTSPRFFLWRIVSNLMIDWSRRDRRRGVHAALDDVAEHFADPAPLPDRVLEGREEFRIIVTTLDALPRKCRAALLLNRVEGLSHVEIADRLGVSPSMVSKYVVTALRRCMKALAVPGG